MTYSTDDNSKYLLCLHTKISTILGNKRQLGRATWKIQKFITRPLIQAARISKYKSCWTRENKTFQGAHSGRGSIRIQQFPKTKDWSGIILHKIWNMWHERTQRLNINQLFLSWDSSDRHKISLLHLHSSILFIIYFMHIFLCRTAVPAKFMDFTGSQSSVFDYHHLNCI